MAWSDEQLELLACAACGGWHITAENFSMVADLGKRGYLKVVDGDDGAIRAIATESGVKQALIMNIIIKGEHSWSEYDYGERHPAIIMRDAKAARKHKRKFTWSNECQK